ncbi:flagellar motor protein MotB [Paenibacillus sp. F411]|uniref:OmpA/MotB domain protein n=1 Tax=Paenibacillus algicola TaxID=2565926 RepID=A0A4P8XHP9_9BACL|nr:flagellar motor protein MotB [Paenibacillus algicola]MBO2946052.1 flagellar motor protein MotB [Paenibacillus sp. F411]QCT00821.1 OmpA/MotB domain protein [Paenibacillus algicola]
MSKKTRHEPHEEHADESWLLPYADLLTLLLALFLVLYAMSASDAKKFQEMSEAFSSVLNGGASVLEYNNTKPSQEPADVGKFNAVTNVKTEAPKPTEQAAREALMKKEQEELEKLKQQLDKYIKDNGLTTELSTKLNHSQLMITIRDNALFASGEAVIKTDSRKLAEEISKMLQQVPAYDIIVSGHTDNVPMNSAKYPSNWDLSSDRALQFMKILLLNKSLDPKRFMPIGYGEYHPIATNDTSAGRAKNRRVEVSIIRKYQDNNAYINVTNTKDEK